MIRSRDGKNFFRSSSTPSADFFRDSGEPICARKRSTLAGPNPPEMVEEVHKAQRKCIRTGTFHSRLTLKKHAEMRKRSEGCTD